MKKTLWMLGVAVAALTSCTQSEVVDIPESKLIGFDTFVDKPTRADVENSNFTEFQVYGAKGNKVTDDNNKTTFQSDEAINNYYLHNITVSRTDADSPWGYSPAKEWIHGKYYRFAAYADGEDNNTTGLNVTFNPSKEYTVPTKEEGEQTLEDHWGLTFKDYTASDKDLIASTSSERNTIDDYSSQGAVNFTFAHLLAKVQFRFSYIVDASETEETQVHLHPFKMNAIKTATCDVFHDETFETGGEEANKTYTYVLWDSQYITPDNVNVNENLGDYDFFPKADDDALGYTILDKNTQAVTYTVYVIPQSNNFTILDGGEDDELIVEIYKRPKNSEDEGEWTRTSVLTYKNLSLAVSEHNNYWKPGHLYRYQGTLNANRQYIEFTASAKAWIDSKNDDAVIGSGEASPADDSGDGE